MFLELCNPREQETGTVHAKKQGFYCVNNSHSNGKTF